MQMHHQQQEQPGEVEEEQFLGNLRQEIAIEPKSATTRAKL